VTRLLAILLLALGSLFVAGVARAEDPADRELARRIGPAVVQLVEKDGEKVRSQGTGFFVRADGVLVTNHHVIAHVEYPMTAVLRDGKKVAVLGVLADDEAHDLALLRVEGGGYTALPLAPMDSIHEGQRVMLVGNPFGFGGSVFYGTLSAIRAEMPAEWKEANAAAGIHTQGPFVQHSIQAGPGSSGSPLLDAEGRVVGVNHSGIPGSEIAFAAHASLLRDLLATTRLDAPPKRLGPDVRKNLVISGAVFGALALGVVAWVVVSRRRARKPDPPRVVH
jgi:S1-C subfamily serine protease